MKNADASPTSVDEVGDLVASLVAMGLAAPGDRPTATRLTGGVSSDIWKVDLRRGPVCVKRALARLRVAADWRAPVERNSYEVAWMRTAGAIVPDAVPAVLGEDAAGGAFAMAYLEPDRHPVWKSLLRDGIAEPATAAAVGVTLSRIHGATAGRADMAAGFATDHIFHPIRLEPYLLATAVAHPDRADALKALAETTAGNKKALVHGDVSPKNILVGPHGPVFIDAECAWYGDPAFDAAFCLNHLLLKCIWRPATAEAFLACFDALAGRYMAGITWEPPPDIESRIARLLPGLLLGRIDGKSPVEYITEDRDRNKVRGVARRLLAAPPASLAEVREAWEGIL